MESGVTFVVEFERQPAIILPSRDGNETGSNETETPLTEESNEDFITTSYIGTSKYGGRTASRGLPYHEVVIMPPL